MEPATLYMVFKLADGPAEGWRWSLSSMEECQTSLADLKKKKPADAEILQSACLPNAVYREPPRWYADALKERVINGVPLDEEYMPRSATW